MHRHPNRRPNLTLKYVRQVNLNKRIEVPLFLVPLLVLLFPIRAADQVRDRLIASRTSLLSLFLRISASVVFVYIKKSR